MSSEFDLDWNFSAQPKNIDIEAVRVPNGTAVEIGRNGLDCAKQDVKDAVAMREKATEISDTARSLEASAKKAERMIPEYLAAKRSQLFSSLTRQKIFLYSRPKMLGATWRQIKVSWNVKDFEKVLKELLSSIF